MSAKVEKRNVLEVLNFTSDAVYFYRESDVQAGHFSEWYPTSFKDDKGTVFVTVEQYKTYHKALLMGDKKTASKVLQTDNPKEHKALGRSVENWNPTLWNKHAEAICFQGNLLKFKQNSRLAHWLNKTDELRLVNANPYDCVWGIGLEMEDKRVLDPRAWRGQNRLGTVLMRVRTELRRLGILGSPMHLTNVETGEVVSID